MRYEVRVVGGESRAGWEAVRFDPSSGRAWQARDNAWHDIPEPWPPPGLGEYEVALTPLAGGNVAVVRWDRRTGRTWFMQNHAWVPLPDA